MTVREVLARRAGGAIDLTTVDDDTPLGADGIGLDSVAIVEVLLECETAFAVRLPPDLFEGPAITIGGLAAAVDRARPSTRSSSGVS
jgi:acyl carrier protein